MYVCIYIDILYKKLNILMLRVMMYIVVHGWAGVFWDDEESE